MISLEHLCPMCKVSMLPVQDGDYPNLPTFLCYRCGFHPNTVIMDDFQLYEAYAWFYARFRKTLEPEITRTDTGLRITRKSYRTLFKSIT